MTQRRIYLAGAIALGATYSLLASVVNDWIAFLIGICGLGVLSWAVRRFGRPEPSSRSDS
jgi:hypothetical protein